MDNKVKDIYQFVPQGYFKDEAEFQKFASDPKNTKDLFLFIQEGTPGAFKNEAELSSYLSLKKKESTQLDSGNGESVSLSKSNKPKVVNTTDEAPVEPKTFSERFSEGLAKNRPINLSESTTIKPTTLGKVGEKPVVKPVSEEKIPVKAKTLQSAPAQTEMFNQESWDAVLNKIKGTAALSPEDYFNNRAELYAQINLDEDQQKEFTLIKGIENADNEIARLTKLSKLHDNPDILLNLSKAQATKASQEAAYTKYKADKYNQIDSQIKEYQDIINSNTQQDVKDYFNFKIKELNSQKENFFLDQDQKVATEYSKNKQEISKFNVPGSTPKEKLRNYYLLLQDKEERLWKQLNPSDDPNVNALRGSLYALPRVISELVPGVDTEIFDQWQNIHQTIKAISPAVLINRNPIKDIDEGFMESFGKSFAKTLVPASELYINTPSELASKVKQSIAISGIPENAISPIAGTILSDKIKGPESFSSEWWGNIAGTSAGMIPYFVAGTELIKGASMLGKLPVYTRYLKGTKYGKYLVSEPVMTGLGYKTAGYIMPSTSDVLDEATFLSGFLGGVAQVGIEKVLNTKYIASVFNRLFGDQAENMAIMVSKVGNRVGNGLGEYSEEVGNTIGQMLDVYTKTADFNRLKQDFNDNFGTMSKNLELFVASFTMGAIMGSGTGYGKASAERSKDFYSNLSSEDKKKADSFVQRVTQERYNALVAAKKAEIKETGAKVEPVTQKDINDKNEAVDVLSSKESSPQEKQAALSVLADINLKIDSNKIAQTAEAEIKAGDTSVEVKPEDATIEISAQVEPAVAETATTEITEPKPLTNGTQVQMEPQIKGGMPRIMEFKDGTWFQKVGNELSAVSKGVQQEAQNLYDSQNKQRVSGEVGVGQEPIQTKPIEGAGKETPSPSGNVQAPEKVKESGEFVVQGTFNGHQVIAGNKAYEVADYRQIGQRGNTELVENTKGDKKIYTLVTPNTDAFNRRGYMGVSLVLPNTTTKTKGEIQSILEAKTAEVKANLSKERPGSFNKAVDMKYEGVSEAPVIKTTEATPPPIQQPIAPQEKEIKVQAPQEVDETKAGAVELKSMEMANKNVSKFLKDSGIEVNIMKTQADFDKAQQKEGLAAERGTEGMFISKSGKIYINKQNLQKDWARTILYHEATHPVINIIRNTNPEKYKALVNGIKDLANNGNKEIKESINDALNWAKKEYADKPEGTIEDEGIVEVIARIASGRIKFGQIEPTLREKIVEFINQIAKAIGLPPITPKTDTETFKKTARQVADAMRSGKSISKVVGKENVKQYQFDAISNLEGQFSITKFGKTGVKKVPVLDKEEYRKKIENGTLKVSSPQEALGDNTFMLTFPDDLFVGDVFVGNTKVAEFGGGVVYAAAEGESGRMWASVNDKTAKAFADNVNKSLEINKGTSYVVLVKGTDTKHASSMSAKVGFMKALLRYAEKNESMADGLLTAIKEIYSIGNVTKPETAINRFNNYLEGGRGEDGQTMKEAKSAYDGLRASLVKYANPLITKMALEMGYSDGYFNATKLKGKNPSYEASNATVDKIFADILQEDFLKGVPDGQAYAVIKTTSKVVIKHDLSHPSYPWVIQTEDGSPVTLELFDKTFMTYGENEAITGRYDQPTQGPSGRWGVVSYTVPKFKLNPNKKLSGPGTTDLLGVLNKYKVISETEAKAKTQKSIGGRNLAPNGKPSNLNEVQYKQVRTPEFKKWFGDWENDPKNASKIVDENGEPKVMYTGTSKDKDFDKFNVPKNGAWFSDNPSVASMYAESNDSQKSNIDWATGKYTDINTRSRVIPVFLNVRRPQDFKEVTTQEQRDKMSHSATYKKLQALYFQNIYFDKPIGERTDGLYMDDKSTVVVLENPNQIKSAIGNSGKFSPIDNRIQMSTGGREVMNVGGVQQRVKDLPKGLNIVDGFYSPIEKRILEFKQPKASATKWKEIVGAKSDEAVFSGMTEWLNTFKPDQQISKEEVQDFIKNNRVEIKQVIKADNWRGFYDERVAAMNKEYEYFKAKGIGRFGILSTIPDSVFDKLNDADQDRLINLKAEQDFLDDVYFDYGNSRQVLTGAKESEMPKYKKYVERGNFEDYKEILVTAPTEAKAQRANAEIDRRLNDIDEELNTVRTYKKVGDSGTVSDFELVVTDQKKFDKLVAERNSLLEEDKKIYKQLQEAKDAEYRSSHYNEKNIIVHTRTDVRNDQNGDKLFFIEEVQSDWGQQGKKEGFAEKPDVFTSKDVKSIKQEGSLWLIDFGDKYDEVGIRISNFPTEQLAIDEAVKKLNDSQDTLRGNVGGEYKPSKAPYVTNTNAWVKLGLKIALQQAVQADAAKIAWTTGEQQNKRYDLSKQVDAITYEKNEDGTYNIHAGKDSRTVDHQNNVPEVQLESLLGKDIAQRIVNGEGTVDDRAPEYKSLTGVQLSVGGKGMTGFYGNLETPGIIGNAIKALVKELTGKEPTIEASALGYTSDYEDEIISNKDEYDAAIKRAGVFLYKGEVLSKSEAFDYLERGMKIGATFPKVDLQPSIEITPELKSAVEKGMAQFSRGERDVKPTFEEATDLFYKIRSTEGAAKKKALADERKALMDQNPSVKYIDDNIKSILDQLEKKEMATRKGNCP